MVSELFFCFTDKIVGTDFERNPLTHTVTHITIVYSGQGSTNGMLSNVQFYRFGVESGERSSASICADFKQLRP